MPAIVAHHQFGILVANQLPPTIRTFIDAHWNFFILGLQGPDLLFYYKPLSANPVSKLGHDIHRESGHTFFTSALCPELHQALDQLAYLLGVCCHYGLDRGCHPGVDGFAKGDFKTHQALESALDGHIIACQGIHRQRTYYLPTLEDYSPVARTYGLDPMVTKHSAQSFRFYTRLLAFPKLITLGETRMGKEGAFSSLCLPSQSIHHKEVAELYDYLQLSIPRTVELVEAFYHAAQYDMPCPEDCQETFSGHL